MQNLRNNFAGFFDHHTIAGAQPQPRDLIPIVQGCTGDRGSGNFNGFKNRNRCNSPRTADINFKIEKHRGDLARRKFVGNGPARKF